MFEQTRKEKADIILLKLKGFKNDEIDATLRLQDLGCRPANIKEALSLCSSQRQLMNEIAVLVPLKKVAAFQQEAMPYPILYINLKLKRLLEGEYTKDWPANCCYFVGVKIK